MVNGCVYLVSEHETETFFRSLFTSTGSFLERRETRKNPEKKTGIWENMSHFIKKYPAHRESGAEHFLLHHYTTQFIILVVLIMLITIVLIEQHIGQEN